LPSPVPRRRNRSRARSTNERGSFAGSSVTRGNSTSFYDGQGRSGTAIKHGNSTSFYDGRGRYTGSKHRHLAAALNWLFSRVFAS
jgi:hypothetical protein